MDIMYIYDAMMQCMINLRMHAPCKLNYNPYHHTSAAHAWIITVHSSIWYEVDQVQLHQVDQHSSSHSTIRLCYTTTNSQPEIFHIRFGERFCTRRAIAVTHTKGLNYQFVSISELMFVFDVWFWVRV